MLCGHLYNLDPIQEITKKLRHCGIDGMIILISASRNFRYFPSLQEVFEKYPFLQGMDVVNYLFNIISLCIIINSIFIANEGNGIYYKMYIP